MTPAIRRQAVLRRAQRFALLVLALVFCASPSRSARVRPDVDIFPPELEIGERLFLETRFAQFFAAHAPTVNSQLEGGDPTVATTATTGAPFYGPFRGLSMNCRACHLVDEMAAAVDGGMRTYADFGRRSPISAREDGKRTSVRNSPPLVDASIPRPGGMILHFDGEFPSLPALIKGTLTGRNYGWLPTEQARAVAHIARVVREDDGSGILASETGGSYPAVFRADPSVPEAFFLPPEYRLDVTRATDGEILDYVARMIAVYVRGLVFEMDVDGGFVASPFDRFVVENALPRIPDPDESAVAFSARFDRALRRLSDPVFIDEGPFQSHDQLKRFGPEELAGLRIFLAAPSHEGPASEVERVRGGTGNCAACHMPPLFTDFLFHNTGVSQQEYDAVHGEGTFAALAIPGLARRRMRPNEFLPATARHPLAREPFRAIPTPDNPGHVDLGVWNIFANSDFPEAQSRLRRALCEASGGAPASGLISAAPGACSDRALLDNAIAAFKTAGLRDLGHSNPYMHNGEFDTLEQVLALYRTMSDKARSGAVRNPAPELSRIALVESDIPALAAFLRSLNEDYH